MMGIRWKILGFFLLILPEVLIGEEEVTYKYVDSLTYHFYQEQQWDSLIMVGKLALSHQIDYYYLRVRMGIAEFRRERYIPAHHHFEKALQFDSYSQTAKSYRYYSLINAAKRKQAFRLSRGFTDAEKKKEDIRLPLVDHLLLLGGYSFANNENRNGQQTLVEPDHPLGKQLLMGNMMLGSAGFAFNLSPSASLQLNFTSERVYKIDRFQYFLRSHSREKRVIGQNGSYINDFKEIPLLDESTFSSLIHQSELYLHPSIQLDHGLAFGLFANLLFINLNQYAGRLVPVFREDTARYNAFTGEYTKIILEESQFNASQSDTSFFNFLTGLYVSRDYGYVSFELSGSYAKLYNIEQWQADVLLTYFPLGNLNFYGTTGLAYYQTAGTTNLESPSRLLFHQILGVRLWKPIWLEGEFRTGNLNNTHIRRGLVVFNLPDDINYIGGLKISFYAGDHLSLFFRYDYAHKTGYYINSDPMEEANQQVYTFDYQTQNIIGGLQWTF
ncbi:MAG: hypothetical protein P8100_01140 [bacterium]